MVEVGVYFFGISIQPAGETTDRKHLKSGDGPNGLLSLFENKLGFGGYILPRSTYFDLLEPRVSDVNLLFSIRKVRKYNNCLNVSRSAGDRQCR